MTDKEKLDRLINEMYMTSDCMELPDSVITLLRQAANALEAMDSCCLPWAIQLAESVEPIC